MLLFWIVVGVLAWTLCGFLGYGIGKGCEKLAHKEYEHTKYDKHGEFFMWLMAVLGLIGLIAVIVVSLQDHRRLGFCLKMPAELKQ